MFARPDQQGVMPRNLAGMHAQPGDVDWL